MPRRTPTPPTPPRRAEDADGTIHAATGMLWLGDPARFWPHEDGGHPPELPSWGDLCRATDEAPGHAAWVEQKSLALDIGRGNVRFAVSIERDPHTGTPTRITLTVL